MLYTAACMVWLLKRRLKYASLSLWPCGRRVCSIWTSMFMYPSLTCDMSALLVHRYAAGTIASSTHNTPSEDTSCVWMCRSAPVHAVMQECVLGSVVSAGNCTILPLRTWWTCRWSTQENISVFSVPLDHSYETRQRYIIYYRPISSIINRVNRVNRLNRVSRRRLRIYDKMV